MRPLIALLLVAFLLLMSIAADPLVGQKVFWKPGAEANDGTAHVDITTIPFPATVTNMKGDWLLLSRAWVQKKDVMSTQEALDYFTEQIQREPKKASGWGNRGVVWDEKGELDEALKDHAEAIRLDPKYAKAYNNRGLTLVKKSDLDSAIYNFREAIRLDPKDGAAYHNLGLALGKKGDFDNAHGALAEAIRLDPKDANPCNAIAWIKATCTDQRHRDGKEAVKYATKACELNAWKDWGDLDTLAAAYAEAGDFKSAIKWAEKSIGLAPANEKKDVKERLELYRTKKPFREMPKEK